MTTFERPTLFELLPAVHRVRDAEAGNALEALLEVIQAEVEVVEADIEALYDNWFIETCDDWVVPYIADLLGVEGIVPVEGAGFSQRGVVANSIAYRRAKGTVAVLEQLAFDVTGWPARAVEFFQRLATTRSMNHERSGTSDLATVPLRDAGVAELAGTPFSQAAHTLDVRHVDNGRGGHNIPNLGIFLWRLESYAMARASACRHDDHGRYRFDPLGRDMPLFNRRRRERTLDHLATEYNVPGPLRRRALDDELEALRQDLAERSAAATLAATQAAKPEVVDAWFDEERPVLRVYRDAGGGMEEIPPEAIVIADLSGDVADGGWRIPNDERTYRVRVPGRPDDYETFDIDVAVDPVTGRLAFAEPPRKAEVSFGYGFAGDLGGGPYGRRASLAETLPDVAKTTFLYGVTRGEFEPSGEEADERIVDTLAKALKAWNDHLAVRAGRPAFGVIAVMDSRTYEEDVEIRVPERARLLIVAADWPALGRAEGTLAPEDVRPHLLGKLTVKPAAAGAEAPGEFTLDGLLLEGSLEIKKGELAALRIAHCTLASAASPAALTVPTGAVSLVRAITGPLTVTDGARSLRVTDSVVGSGAGPAIDADVPVAVEASTILGTSTVQSLEASNSIFTGRVVAERRQRGCVRYCYLPVDSAVPRRFRCHPVDEAAARRVGPVFSSTRLGRPGFAQLAASCPPEIAAGADDESEMGAFHFLAQPQRARNLAAQLDGYLRYGLEAGVFFVT